MKYDEYDAVKWVENYIKSTELDEGFKFNRTLDQLGKKRKQMVTMDYVDNCAMKVIQQYKGQEKGFSCLAEARRYGMSPPTLKKGIIRMCKNTPYQLETFINRTCILKRAK